jgi:choline dehydrogenase
LPGVGENLQDHLEMYLQYECTQPVSLYPALKWWNQPAIGIEWYLRGTGLGASNHFEAGGFIRSSTEFAWPNLQYHFIPLAMNYDGSNPVKAHGFQCHVGSMRSPSTGSVKLRSRDARAAPVLRFNYMAHDTDWQEFRAGVRLTRDIISQQALDAYRGREVQPGANVRSDAEIDAFVRQHAETALHPSCTCKMGDASDPMAVVDHQGRVHGTSGLRVVDASIMPQVVTGNLNAPTIMLAEKIADHIRGRPPLAVQPVPYFVARGQATQLAHSNHKLQLWPPGQPHT